MKKFLLKALCLMLTIMTVSTMFVFASTTDVIMETIHEETNIVDNTGYFRVDAPWVAAPVSFADGKWTMKHESSGNHGINFHILKGSDLLKEIKNLDNVVYTVSFDLHKADMEKNFTVFSLGYGNTPAESSNIVIQDSSDKNTLSIYGPEGNDIIYAPWTENGTVKCTLTYNSATKEMAVKAEGHKAVVKSTLSNTANSNSSTGYGLRLKCADNNAGQISVSNVEMKVEQPSDKPVVDQTGYETVAENNNIASAASGDLQVIHWNPSNSETHTMTSDSGKFTLAASGSGNRGIILGLPKSSTIKNDADMTKAVYTASFKLHRGDRGGDFSIDVLGYHSSSVENTAIVLLNEERNGKFYFNTSGAEGTAEWNKDDTVECILTYNAETKVATVKVGEAEISKTMTGDYNASNAAAAYGFRVKGPSSGNTTINISNVSLKMEQPAEEPIVDPTEYEIIAEQNNVNNTSSDLIVTNFSGAALIVENGQYSQSGTSGDANNNNYGNHAIGFKFVENNVDDVNNVIYTASFNIHNDIERDVTVNLIRKSGTVGKSVLTFKKLDTGVRIYDATSNNTKYIDSSYTDGKAPCTIVYNAITKVLTVKVGSKILMIENIEAEVGAEYTMFRCKIADSIWSQHQGAKEQFTVSDVSMKMEKPIINLTVTGNTISLPLYTPAGGSDKLIIVSYDDNGILNDVDIKDIDTPSAEEIANKKYEFTTNLTGKVRIFLWDDFVNVKPLINSADYSI